jgi:glycosyltransferase involved in cell wall biosynthesis
MTIALHVMTKNGRIKLPDLVKSVVGFCDSAVVLDTGSTDGTEQWCRSQDLMPIKVYDEPFVNFEVSRNRGMQLAKGSADWILLLDDDMRLIPEVPYDEVKAKLDPLANAYLLRMNQRVTYWNTRLVRGDVDWRYIGVTHEYLDRSLGSVKLEGLHIDHHYCHGPDKFERDARLLAADIARDPYNARTIFYLAQTFRDMRHIVPAIRYYEMRAKMGGWDEEVYFAMYEAARLASDPKAMQQCYYFRPTRAEPAAWLRDWYRKAGDPGQAEFWNDRTKIPMPKDILFVDQKAYQS